ncbi:hypothetical protein GCM10023149_19200 [Mucilaginibacter gynuensis]|uniref:Uncharacterized protein n=1 Tax=Mucilaginibacter gynuensis TaxID=1302236 RepID=A0ABP8G9I6_9SPHI
MRNITQKEIPRSIIKGGGGIGIDANFLDGKGKILFLNPVCTILGMGDIPHTMFTTPQFQEVALPPNITERIYELKRFIFQPTFSKPDLIKKDYAAISKWISDFKNIEELIFRHVTLDHLEDITDVPVQHLIFEDIKFNDDKRLIEAIAKFKNLKEISHDQSLPEELITSLKNPNLKLTVITEHE